MGMCIVILVSLIFMLIALATDKNKHNKVVRCIRYSIGIVGFICLVYMLICDFRSEPYIETDIQNYKIEKSWARGLPQYYVIYTVDDNIELVNIAELDINYNSDKNIIQIYKRGLPDFLIDDRSTKKVVIYTTDSPNDKELDDLDYLKNH